MAKFKSKKRYNNKIIYLALFLISGSLTIKYLYDEDLINQGTIVDYLINDNLGSFKNNISDVDFLLKYALNINLNKEKTVFNIEDEQNKVEVEENKEEVKDNNEELLKEPLLYIYNSHQTEQYQNNNLAPYNISTTVLLASKILKEYIEDEGIGVIVEEGSMEEKLKSLNLKYNSSYKVARMFMESIVLEHPSLNYFIDLHRDSSKYATTTATINGEKYARILFVIGEENKNYEVNYELATKLRTKLEEFDKTLVRGILKKSGAGVNGIYNQDFNPNAILIEVGGQYNSISEVNNTLQVLAKVIGQYIKEDLNSEKEKN